MKANHLPLSELVAGFFYLAIILAFTMLVGCRGDERPFEPATIVAAEPVAPVPTPALIPELPPQPARLVTFADAEAEFNAGRFDVATELFAEWTQRNGENPWGFYMLGLSARKTGQYDQAEAALRTAIELDPTHVKSRINLARVLLDVERTNEAIAELGFVFAEDPGLGDAWRLRGRAMHQSGSLQEAADAYREAIRIDENDAWAMNNLGLVLIDEGLYAEAVPSLAQATKLRDDVPAFFNNLGMALEHRGNYRSAEIAYAKALELDPAYNHAFENLNRISAVAQDLSVDPVDLDIAAAQFVEEVASWSDEAVAREEPLVKPADDLTTDDPAEVEPAGDTATDIPAEVEPDPGASDRGTVADSVTVAVARPDTTGINR